MADGRKQLSTTNPYGLTDSDLRMLQEVLGDAMQKGAKKSEATFADLGAKAGQAMGNVLGKNLSQMFGSWWGTMGTFDPVKSFGSGAGLAKQLREEFSKYTFGTNNLQALSSSIYDTYKALKKDGILVDPQKLYQNLGEVSKMVSIAGTQTNELVKLNAVVSKIQQSGVPISTTAEQSNIARSMFGADVLADISGTISAITGRYSNLTASAAQQFYDQNTALFSRLATTSGGDAEKYRQSVSDIFSTYGALSDVTNLSTANALMGVYSSLLTNKSGWAGLFSSDSVLAGEMLKLGYDSTKLTAMGSGNFAPQDLAVVAKALRNIGQQYEYGTLASSPVLRGTFSAEQISYLAGLSDTELDAALGAITGVSSTDVKRAQRAQSTYVTRQEEMNFESVMAGFNAGTITYQNAVLEELGMIGGILKSSGLVNAGSEVASGLLSGAISGAMIKGAGSTAIGSMASGGGKAFFSAIASKAPAMGWIGAIVAVIAALGIAITSEIESNQASAVRGASTIGQVLGSNGLSNYTVESIAGRSLTTGSTASTSVKNLYNMLDRYRLFNPNTYGMGVSSEDVEYLERLGVQNINEAKLSGHLLAEYEGARNDPGLNLYLDSYDQIGDPDATEQYLRSIYLYKKGEKEGKGLYYLGQIFNELFGVDTSLSDASQSTAGDHSFSRWLYEAANPANIVHLGDEALNKNTRTFHLWESNDLRTGIGVGNWQDWWVKFGKNTPYNMIEWKNRYMEMFEALPEKVGGLPQDFSNIENIGVLNLANAIASGSYSYAVGTDFVPENGISYLHKGEMVIPARRANYLRRLMGQPITDYSAVAANALTGSNSLVQSIPDTFSIGATSNLEAVSTYVVEAMEILNKRICTRLDTIIQNQQNRVATATVQTSIRSSQIAEFAPILLQ